MKKILRWLLSHLLLILVIVSVIYGYMFWGNLTGESTPAGKAVAYVAEEFDGVGKFVEGVKNKQARLAGLQLDDVQLDDRQLNEQVDSISAEQSVSELDKSLEGELATGLKSTMANLGAENSQQDMGTGNQIVADAAEDTNLNVSAVKASDDPAVSAVQNEQLKSEQDSSEQDKSEQDNKQINSEQTNSNLVVAEQSLAATSQSQQGAESKSVEQPPVSISYSHNNTRVQQNSDGELEVQPAVSVAGDEIRQKDAAVDKDGFIPAEIANQLEKVDENSGWLKTPSVEKNTQVTAGAMSIPEIWVAARMAFYQKNYDLSEKSYQSLIAETKGNFDAYGELGNVYFNQGKKAQAAEAYLQAATILLAHGDVQRVQSLLRVLQQLDVEKANQLQQLMGLPAS